MSSRGRWLDSRRHFLTSHLPHHFHYSQSTTIIVSKSSRSPRSIPRRPSPIALASSPTMAPNTAYYRTIINGVGYRFALPLLLGPPPRLGDLVDIEVTLFLKDPNKVITTSPAASGPVTRRSPSLDFPTLDIVLAGASWQLPLLEAGRVGDDDEMYKVQIRRMPPPSQSPLPPIPLSRSGNENATEEVTLLELNEGYNNQVNRTQYVDILPNHDPPPSRAFFTEHLVNPTTWAVSTHLRTWFRLTKVDKSERARDWHNLNHQGVPCKVRDGRYLSIAADGFSAVDLKMTCDPLQDGDAQLKLVPVPADYACQPATASAEASHILDRYCIIVEQGGRQHRVYEPVRKGIDEGWRGVLRVLAEYDSAETASSFTYSEECGETDEFYDFGVRLRDGGARLPLKFKSGSTSTTRLRLPGIALDYASYGTCISIDEAGANSRVFADVHLHSGTDEPHDIVFKVRDHAGGAYKEIMYALREREELRAVSEGQWRTFDSSHTDEATLRFIANAARTSFGKDRLRPQCPPRSSRENSPEDDSPEREEKKPRLS